MDILKINKIAQPNIKLIEKDIDDTESNKSPLMSGRATKTVKGNPVIAKPEPSDMQCTDSTRSYSDYKITPRGEQGVQSSSHLFSRDDVLRPQPNDIIVMQQYYNEPKTGDSGSQKVVSADRAALSQKLIPDSSFTLNPFQSSSVQFLPGKNVLPETVKDLLATSSGLNDEQDHERKKIKNRIYKQKYRNAIREEVRLLENEFGDQAKAMRDSITHSNLVNVEIIKETVLFYKKKGIKIDRPDSEVAKLIDQYRSAKSSEIFKRRNNFTEDEYIDFLKLENMIHVNLQAKKSRAKARAYRSCLRALSRSATAQEMAPSLTQVPSMPCETVSRRPEALVFPSSNKPIPDALRDREYSSTLHKRIETVCYNP